MKSTKVFVQTYGCQMNVYDSSKMLDVLHAADPGVIATDDPMQADIILLNTCSIREKAQEKVFSDLGRYREIKVSRPDLVIGVGGCVASQEGEVITKRAPYVNVVFGPQTLHRLPALLAETKATQKPAMDISFPEIEKFDKLPEPRAEGPSAYVSIMEGCSKYCSYCIVPYTRGEEVSRPLDDVLAEVVALTTQGVKEIHLLGQNVNDYQGKRHEGGTADLADLIRYIAALPDIARIRFTTSHPAAFSDKLIATYADVPKLVDHLHLPVQSGSNRILGMMKRGYTVERYIEQIAKLRAIRPHISISSDFIVGFPDETEEDFLATMSLIEHIGFDTSFSFIYSPRPGTPAAKLHDGVSETEKKRRLAILQHRIIQHALTISQAMVGTTVPVLVTGKAKKHQGQLAARTENNRVVNVYGDEKLIGSIINVLITAAEPNSLRGELV